MLNLVEFLINIYFSFSLLQQGNGAEDGPDLSQWMLTWCVGLHQKLQWMLKQQEWRKRSNDIPALRKKRLPIPSLLFFVLRNCHLKNWPEDSDYICHSLFALAPHMLPWFSGFYELPLQSTPSPSLNMPFKKKNIIEEIALFKFLGLKWLKWAWYYCIFLC